MIYEATNHTDVTLVIGGTMVHPHQTVVWSEEFYLRHLDVIEGTIKRLGSNLELSVRKSSQEAPDKPPGVYLVTRKEYDNASMEKQNELMDKMLKMEEAGVKVILE